MSDLKRGVHYGCLKSSVDLKRVILLLPIMPDLKRAILLFNHCGWLKNSYTTCYDHIWHTNSYTTQSTLFGSLKYLYYFLLLISDLFYLISFLAAFKICILLVTQFISIILIFILLNTLYLTFDYVYWCLSGIIIIVCFQIIVNLYFYPFLQ